MIFHLEFDGEAVYIWDRNYDNMWPIIRPDGDLDFYSLQFKMSDTDEIPELNLKTLLEMVMAEVEEERR